MSSNKNREDALCRTAPRPIKGGRDEIIRLGCDGRNEQGQGVIRIDVRDGPTLANQVNFYSRVVDDIAKTIEQEPPK